MSDTVEVVVSKELVEIVDQGIEIVVSPQEEVVVISHEGMQGPQGPKGDPGGTGVAWTTVRQISTPGTYQLDTDDEYIEVDPTDGDITIVLQPFIDVLHLTKKVVRVTDSQHMVYVTAAGDIGGEDAIELAYKGEYVDFVAQESGWW